MRLGVARYSEYVTLHSLPEYRDLYYQGEFCLGDRDNTSGVVCGGWGLSDTILTLMLTLRSGAEVCYRFDSERKIWWCGHYVPNWGLRDAHGWDRSVPHHPKDGVRTLRLLCWLMFGMQIGNPPFAKNPKWLHPLLDVGDLR